MVKSPEAISDEPTDVVCSFATSISRFVGKLSKLSTTYYVERNTMYDFQVLQQTLITCDIITLRVVEKA
jgi:hypothetical protein